MVPLASCTTHCCSSPVSRELMQGCRLVSNPLMNSQSFCSLLRASLALPAAATGRDSHPAALHLSGWSAPAGALRLLHSLPAHLCGSHAAPNRSLRALQALLHDQTGYRIINRIVYFTSLHYFWNCLGGVQDKYDVANWVGNYSRLGHTQRMWVNVGLSC